MIEREWPNMSDSLDLDGNGWLNKCPAIMCLIQSAENAPEKNPVRV